MFKEADLLFLVAEGLEAEPSNLTIGDGVSFLLLKKMRSFFCLDPA